MTFLQECIEIENQNKEIFNAILKARGLKSFKDIPNFDSKILDTEIALNIAKSAHEGAFDKGGHPYIDHPVTVASNFSCTYRICTAYLHDVVEDTEYTIEMLLEKGVDPRVAEAVRVITHDKSVNYFDYLEIVSKDPIAVDVKIADMMHNSDISRIIPEDLKEKNLLRLKRYNNGLKFLSERNFGVKY